MSIDPEFSGPARRQVHVADTEYRAVAEGRIRIRIGAAIFAFALMVAVIRLAEVSLLSSGKNTNNYSQSAKLERADIVDRNGELLATTLTTYTLYARSEYVWNAAETARALHELFPDMEAQDFQRRLTRPGDQLLIRRGLTPKEKQNVFLLGQPGLMFEAEPQRVYPRGHLASHIVGFTDVDLKGLAGSERAFDTALSEPNAPSLALSVDLRVQNAAAEELQKSLEHFKADTGAAIVMDMNNGEILAMASLPNYDPNHPNTTSPQNLYNHASMSTYELGSVFKPITMAMALEYGVTDLVETFPVQKPLKVRDKYIRDDHPSQHPIAMPTILADSSNRGTAMIAQRVGGDRQQMFLKELGLMDRVPIELTESAAPQVQREWQDITTVTVSYGHGISVTPLALTTAIATLLNGGEYVAPTLRKRDTVHTAQKRRVITAETSQKLRDLMRYVATDGTGKKADVDGYAIMGKTGTADKPSINGYDERRLVSSFIAAFPYQDPQYVVFVTFDEPKAVEGTHGYATAGWNAAPTAGKIIERIAPILGVERDTGPVLESPFSETPAVR
ncbi:MAG: penicillin-binding protein 2 [Hellea sp.]|nr:penicillin-binding protein 2 [Hellea sp.]